MKHGLRYPPPMCIGVVVWSLAVACHGATEPSGTRVELQNIVDPESVNAVSLFNSCVGHAFPQPNSPNSAKNYFWPNSTTFSTNDRLRVLAACAGTVRQNARWCVRR